MTDQVTTRGVDGGSRKRRKLTMLTRLLHRIKQRLLKLRRRCDPECPHDYVSYRLLWNVTDEGGHFTDGKFMGMCDWCGKLEHFHAKSFEEMEHRLSRSFRGRLSLVQSVVEDE